MAQERSSRSAKKAAAATPRTCTGCPFEAVEFVEGQSPGAILGELVACLAEDRRALEATLAALAVAGSAPRSGSTEATAAGDPGSAGRFGRLLERLYDAVGHQLDDVEQAGAGTAGGATEKDARTIQTLAKTMETLKGLDGRTAGEAGAALEDVDLDHVRAELAKRLERFGSKG